MSARRLVVGVLVLLALAACRAPVRPEPASSVSAPPAAPSVAPVLETAPVPPPPTVPPPVVRELTGGDVFARLVARLADAPCVEDRVVQRWEHIYSRWPPRFAASLEHVLPLMALVLDEIEIHQLPGEFALVPIVESWYRPDAGSPRTAYGLWQFTTATARNQGLRIGPGYDERLAPQASTRAAMRYLSNLLNRFGDWKLADMAFNAGEYRLHRVLAKASDTTVSAAAHRPPGLAMTTYEHVAKVQALACLLAQPQRFGLTLPTEVRIEPLQEVRWPGDLATFEAVAGRSGLAAASLRALNPGYLRGRRVLDGPRELLLPRTAAERLATSAASTDRPPSAPVADVPPTPREYIVRRGDTLGAIAKRHGVALRSLLNWNGIKVSALIRPGQVLRLSAPE